MTNVEDKLKLFSKIVYDKIEQEKETKLKRFEEEKKITLENEKKSIEKMRVELIKETTKRANVKANEIIAKEKITKQKEILAVKSRCISNIMNEVRIKLSTFTKSNDYEVYLIKLINETLDSSKAEEVNIKLTKRDIDLFEDKIKNLLNNKLNKKINILELEDFFIGGVVLQEVSGVFKIDNSLSYKLEECKEMIGVRVMEMLT